MTVVFREANLNDLANIAGLHAQSWRENYNEVLAADYLDEKIFIEREQVWLERLTNPPENQYVLVAELNGSFCGFVCVYGDQHPTYGSIIDNLHVKSNIKGQGLGTRLLIAGARWAAKHFAELGLYLEVLECNENAIGFYESLGGKNIDIAYWHTPCGNKVKEFIYSWKSPAELAN